MTPWQFQQRLDDHAETERHAADERLSLAWFIGAAPRMKKLPALAGLLARGNAPTPAAKGIDEDAIRAQFAALIRQQNEAVH